MRKIFKCFKFINIFLINFMSKDSSWLLIIYAIFAITLFKIYLNSFTFKLIVVTIVVTIFVILALLLGIPLEALDEIEFLKDWLKDLAKDWPKDWPSKDS